MNSAFKVEYLSHYECKTNTFCFYKEQKIYIGMYPLGTAFQKPLDFTTFLLYCSRALVDNKLKLI